MVVKMAFVNLLDNFEPVTHGTLLHGQSQDGSLLSLIKQQT